MLKRKVSTSYADSSDVSGSESTKPPLTLKKSRSLIASLPRLSTSTVPGQAPFQAPAMRPPFGQHFGVLGRPGSSRSTSLSAPQTPALSNCPLSSDEDEPDGETSQACSKSQERFDTKGKKPSSSLHPDNSQTLASGLARGRSVVTLERQVNELSTKLEAYQEASNAQQKLTNERLSDLFNLLSQRIPVSPAHEPGSAPIIRAGQPSLAPQNVAPDQVIPARDALMSNPMPWPELAEIISVVTTLSPPELGGLKNAIFEHNRKAWCRMLRCNNAGDISPPFEDQFGQPDTLPLIAIDPVTKYCHPFPHWNFSLASQIIWIPTFLSWFRAMIPNNNSELSLALSSLSDKDICILMERGPWKTARGAWRTMNKSPEALAESRAIRLKYHKSARKATIRLEYIRTIPALQGQEFEFLTAHNYMSEEEEVDGVTLVRRPAFRASWVNNLFDAIQSAELDRLRSRNGQSFSPSPRQVLVVEAPIPKLERSTGRIKAAVLIAASSFSKSWKNKHISIYEQAAHRHPRPSIDGTPDVQETSNTCGLDRRRTGCAQTGSFSDVSHDIDSEPEVGEYDGAYGRRAQTDDIKSTEQEIAQSTRNDSNNLLEPTNHENGHDARYNFANKTILVSNHVPVDAPDRPPFVTEEVAKALDHTIAAASNQAFSMPPPPVLTVPIDVLLSENHDIGADTIQQLLRTKDEQQSQLTDSKRAAPKKRGRPPGAKNKPKGQSQP
ncbi:hypothetical protein RHS01_01388 [Rhizoctonia solani]|uniref:Uncharacterized protein n=1 Tax=Rhizoctonia solani TaxID=456999 RepID=A0A8H7IIW1_9AGAM|nr:hypothetical protein RHS01_01388 [Rhizoctonia solani]